jgi:RHS repeat-associated protein
MRKRAIASRLIFFAFFGCLTFNKANAQTYATATEKAHAKYITDSIITASDLRREENHNESSGAEVAAGAEAVIGSLRFEIDGPKEVDRISQQGYTMVPRAPKDYWWYVSCGTIVKYYDDLIVILFSNTTCSTSVIKVFNENDELMATFEISIFGDPHPFSAGQILTGSQSVKVDILPGTLLASSAQGGSCSSNYAYQWQYSYDDSAYTILDDATADTLGFESGIDRSVYFRRRVVCGTDTMYTASVAVFLVPPFNPGTITTPSQTILINTVPPVINATGASNGECSAYSYQWQQSADGFSFANIGGATTQNLSYPTPITGNIFFRRQATCNTDMKFSTPVNIRVRENVTPAPVVKNTIDSLLESAGVNLLTLFNIYNDSVANNRPAPNPSMDSLETAMRDGQMLFQLNKGVGSLTAAEIDSLATSSPTDNIQARLTASENGTVDADTTPVFIPFIDDNLIQLYRSTGNYAALDSIISDLPEVSFEEASYPVEVSLYNPIPDSQRTYIPQINTLGMKQSAVIDGEAIVERNQVVHYTASFNFSPGSSGVQWVVKGGTIVSQNTNPASGEIFADVHWESSAGIPYIAIFDIGTNQYRVFPVYFYFLSCRIYPALQTLYYGQVPARLKATLCFSPGGSSIQYQWQVLDVYANTNWTDIPGATNIVYQPPALIRPWLMYRRLTKILDANGGLIAINPSSASSVKMFELNNGQYQIASYNVEYNHVPSVITQPASGGMLVQPGGVYSYLWEASVNDGTWQTIGTSETFPNYPIRDKKVAIRRVVTITGVPASVYTLPERFWKGTSPTFIFTYYYKTVDFENRNYIRENVVLTRGIDHWEDADLLTSDKKIQTTTYLDGLSRPIQVVGKGIHYDEANNQWYDMVQSITYEAGGRVDRALLGYPTIDNFGKFKTNVVTAQPAYYQSKFGENNAFARVEYDNSPQNRAKKSFGPGDSWVGSNINVSGDIEPYNSNEAVHRFTVNYTAGNIPVNYGIYPSLFLIKVYGMDEKGKKVISYSDKTGQIVLKKVQLEDGANLTNQHAGWLCTYYVYDDLGQLRFTITPKAVKEIEANNWVISTGVANELCFWYDYDELGRTVAKKVPGKNPEYIVYDRKNRPVFTQDAGIALSEDNNPLLTTLYDELNRPVISGLLLGRKITDWESFSAGDPTAVITVNTTYGGTIKIQGSPLTAAEINDPATFEQLSFNYYDSYSYSGAKTFDANHINNLSYKNIAVRGNVDPNTQTKRFLGMATGGKTRVMNRNYTTPTFITSSVFYDEEGRGVQGQADNIKGGVEISSTQYHFDGRVLSTSQTHNGTGTAFTNFNILTKYKFDKNGRIVGVGKKINSASRNYITSPNVTTAQEDDDAGYKIIASYKFNELNRLVKKTISPTYNNGQGLETIDYSYNMRGWLTGINKDYALDEYNSSQWEHFFGIYLGYDNRDGKFEAPQYNGSITGVQWKSQGDNTPRKFDYEYDNAGRFKKANFNQRGSSTEGWNKNAVDFSTKDIMYDENGNLLSMTQMGIVPGILTPITVDNLTYQYLTKSNKLRSVTDQATSSGNGKLGDFKDGNNAAGTDDYSYDDNGRLILDNNKRISNVQYSYLDKPELITIAPPPGGTGGGTIRYIYAAGGGKMQKIVTENPSAANGNQQRIITTTYISAYIYEQVTIAGVPQPEVLQMIQHGEGRIRIITPYNNPADPANFIGGGIDLPGGKHGVFDYFIKDNLGNVRATITEEINKAAGVCTMEDANAAIKQSEEAMFGNPGANNEVNTTRIAVPAGWASNQPPTNNNQKVSKLQATGGVARVGPNAFLKIMAGDKIRAKVDYYYQSDPGASSNTNAAINALVSSFGSALVSGRTVAVTHGNEAAITGNLNSNAGLIDMFNNPPAGSSQNPNAPRAYLNYIFFDEQFNFVKEISGFKRVSQPGDGASPIVVDDIKATKNGYVYIYLTNESGEPVYFDNFSVGHERGRLIAEDHYYTYGLKITSISSKSINSSLNPNLVKHGYQGSFSEEVSEFELNYNEFALRTYDPQIGRWTTADPYDEFASPYLGMGTDPANNVDPNGGSIFGAIWAFFGGGSSGAGCAATAGMSGYGYVASTTASTFATVARVAMTAISIGGAAYQHFGGQMMSNYVSGMQGINGGSPGQDGGAADGGGVNEPGDGIPQALNNNISTNSGNSGSTDQESSPKEDCGESLYGLYESADAAAFGWSRVCGVYGQKGAIEYSAVIYSITTKKGLFFGFTRAVRFSDNNKEGYDPSSASPGPDDAIHLISMFPTGAEIVAHIHIHYKSSSPENKYFSFGMRDFNGVWHPKDQGLISDHGDLAFYLLNNAGEIMKHRPGATGKNYQYPIGENFYDPGDVDETINDPNGKKTRKYWHNVPSIIPGATPFLQQYSDTFPKYYIDKCGHLYNLDGTVVK